MTRERLRNRRPNLSTSIEWSGHRLSVCAGFNPETGRLLEVFVRAGRPDGHLDQLADDVAVLISRGLQHGDGLADLAHGLGRLPDGTPTSIAGVILDELLHLEEAAQ
jgi:hypothetical protein